MKYTKEKLESIAKESSSIREVLQKVNLAPRGGNYAIMKNRLAKMEIDISHFKGNGWRRGLKFNTGKKKLDELFIKNSVYTSGSPYQSSKLKAIIFRNNLKERRCEICNVENWNKKELSFELHHIDGDSSNNELINLQILCPNCHSQTDNFRGKNIK